MLLNTDSMFSTGDMLLMHYKLVNEELMQWQDLSMLEFLYTNVEAPNNVGKDFSNSSSQLLSSLSENNITLRCFDT